MKYLLLFIFFFAYSTLTFSQSSTTSQKKASEIRENVWKDSSGFTEITIPKKWKNESAVILNQKRTFTYSRASNDYLQSEEIIRSRIKILDNAALETFSEFYYFDIKKGIYIPTSIYTINTIYPRIVVGFKIVKPNGNEIVVNLDGEAIEYGEIPKRIDLFIYRAIAIPKKAAIPNLEIGDIVDFFYYTRLLSPIGRVNQSSRDFEYYARNGVKFSSNYIPLTNEYSINKQSIEINLKRKNKYFYLNFLSMNGAPKVRLVEEIIENKRGKTIKSEYIKYVLVDTNRNSNKYKYFNSPYREDITIKFQVYYVPPNQKIRTEYFFSEKNIPNSTAPSNYEIQAKTSKKITFAYGSNHFAEKVLKQVKKKKKNTSIEEQIKQAYYLLRYIYIFDNKTPGRDILDFALTGRINQKIYEENINPEFFAEIMRKILEGLKIEYDITVAMPNYLGGFDDLLLDSELEIIITAYDDMKAPIHLFPFTLYTDYNTIPSSYSGVETLVFPKKINSKIDLSKIDSLPILKPYNNIKLANYEIDVYNSLDSVVVNKIVTNSGIFKTLESDSKLYDEDYRYTLMKKHESSRFEKLKEVEFATLKENKEIIQKERLKLNKKDLENEGLDVREYKNFEIIQLGMDSAEQAFIYRETFELDNFITKAGNNYFIHAGKLTGNQMRINEQHKNKREIDIYLDFPKSYKNVIQINIPDGYTAENLKAFNISIDNKAGSFESSAVTTGTTLIIKTNKTYKASYLPKEDWSLLTNMLEKAYNYSQQKVILKKI